MLRLDVGTLKPAENLSGGMLRVEGFLTRSGVFAYRMPDGSERREYRPPNEVFKEDSLDSFRMVPVTDDHPPELLTSENAKQYAVGSVGETIRRDGDHVAATMVVFDAKTIAKMRSGKVELSCGYDVDLIEKPGTTESGERYDAIQTNIRGNHVALVQVARAGRSARVRLDCGTMVLDNGDEYMEEALKQLAEAMSKISALEARCDAAEKSAQDAKTALDKVQAQADSEKARADKLEQARVDAASGFGEAVKTRVTLEKTAAKVLGEVDLSAKSDREIKCEVVAKLDGSEIPADKSDDYVSARFDGAIEHAAKSAVETVRVAANNAAPSEDPEVAAMKKMKQDSATAWLKVKG